MTSDAEPTTPVVPPPPPPGVERPGWTQGAQSRPDLEETDPRRFPCPRCGADLSYAIGQLALHCGHCGYHHEIELDEDEEPAEQDYDATLQRLEELREKQAEPVPDRHVLQCHNCGAEVVFVGALTATRCAFCGTAIQREDVHTDHERIPVDGVLPFEVTREKAVAALNRWIKSRWFAPGEFLQRTLRTGLQGIYLPYWTFDALTFTHFVGQRGTDRRRRVGSGRNARTVTDTTWRTVSGKFQRFFDDVLCLAIGGEAAPLLPALEPWPLDRLRPFRAEFLAGFQARTYDTRLEAGFVDARQRIDAALRSEVRQRIGGDRQRIQQMDVRYDAITYKHLLLPLWLVSYQHRDKTYHVAVNAVTGEVYGQRPYSATKIGCLVAVIVALILIVLALRWAAG